MSKYNTLWEYVQKSGKESFHLTFEEIQEIAGIPIDHSFLKYKKELAEYGWQVGKISMKEQTVCFHKIDWLPPFSGKHKLQPVSREVRKCLQITAASLWQFLLYFRAFAWSNCSSYFPTIPNHMADMLVKLYNIPYSHDIEENLSKSGIRIKKALGIVGK